MASELRVDRIIPTTGIPTGGGGGVIQVVNHESSSTFTTTSTTSVDVTGMSTTITRKNPNSKILVFHSASINFFTNSSATSGGGYVYVVRDGTTIDYGENFVKIGNTSNNYIDNYNLVTTTCVLDDPPAGNSAITYKIQGLTVSGGQSRTLRYNSIMGSPRIAKLILMEISA
tara:strand:- start:148 stop:663 length:516 start_codon:yes stop_codon:yes gene_type:complete